LPFPWHSRLFTGVEVRGVIMDPYAAVCGIPKPEKVNDIFQVDKKKVYSYLISFLTQVS
jgi:hypothetical protein